MRRAPGFTLLEVLIALIVITVALLGLLGSMAPITALAGQGKARGRAAIVLAARADLLRAAQRANISEETLDAVERQIQAHRKDRPRIPKL